MYMFFNSSQINVISMKTSVYNYPKLSRCNRQKFQNWKKNSRVQRDNVIDIVKNNAFILKRFIWWYNKDTSIKFNW